MNEREKKISQTKKEFRKFCKKNNLRYKLDDGGDPISPTRKRSSEDHIYWSGEENCFGIFISRPSQAKYTHLKKKLIGVGCEVHQDGDREGTLRVSHKNALKAAKLLGTIKSQVSKEKRQAAKKRMQKLWASGKMSRKQ